MIPETNELLRLRLQNYLKCGRLFRYEKIFAAISPSLLYRKNAGLLASAYRKLKFAESHSTFTVNITTYSGVNPVALKISSYLKTNAGDLITGAYVHGSVATSEEIPYSDFDGLVILNNRSFQDGGELFRVVKALKETERMMFEMDPLQHHGWFILTEADLRDFPEHYFPHELFNYSKCLFGSHELNISVREGSIGAFRKSFQHLTGSILKKIEKKNFLENRYVFKSFLSEFMLIPAIYIQASTGKGVFKKFSFEMMEKELGEEFRIMKKISAMRMEWNYRAPDLFVKKLNSGSSLSDHRNTRNYSGSLPDEMKNQFNEDTLSQMRALINNLNKRLQ